jgi:nitrite reductase (NADH) small subunit
MSTTAEPGQALPMAASGDWTVVCRVDDIPMLGSRRVARSQGMPVALFRTADDRVFALLDRCPHKGGPLSQGIVFGDSVACPLHNQTIDLADGQVRAPDEGCTPSFACRVDDGQVLLDVGELARKALDLPAPVAGPCHRSKA